MKQTDEFYIGYLPKAPDRIAARIKSTTALFVLGGLMVLFIVVVFQKKFAASNFEYGEFTSLTGKVSNTPVPHISVSLGYDESGSQIFQNVILVSAGKAGADPIVTNILETRQIKDGSLVELTGFLIYNDGRSLLQISDDDNNAKLISEGPIDQKTKMNSIEMVKVFGEIVDPKCYLGVMKPGEGKAHRSCAIRCISGGMPAVLHADNTGDYFLILDQNGHSINQEILPLVGDQLQLSGQQILWNDWKILKVNREAISQLSSLKMVAAFENGISLCDMSE